MMIAIDGDDGQLEQAGSFVDRTLIVAFSHEPSPNVDLGRERLVHRALVGDL